MGKIIRHTSEELKNMIKQGEDRTDWDRLAAITEEQIEANALADIDNPPVSDEELAMARVVRRVRGSQKAPRKEAVAIRLSQDVLSYFRASGKGWQGRIDAALHEWLQTHKAA